MNPPQSEPLPATAPPAAPTIFTDPAALASHDHPGSAWNRLALVTPHPDPFSATTAWQLSWREAADPGRMLFIRECEGGLVQFAVHTFGGPKVSRIVWCKKFCS